MAHGDGGDGLRTDKLRAEQVVDNHCSPVASDAPVQPPVIAEPAVGSSARKIDIGSENALSVARETVATKFDDILEERWRAGDLGASNRLLAERYVGVEEKTVRRWRKTDHARRNPMPLAALIVLPIDLADELVERLWTTRGARRDMSALRSAVDRLTCTERPLTIAEREELRTLHHRLGGLLYR